MNRHYDAYLCRNYFTQKELDDVRNYWENKIKNQCGNSFLDNFLFRITGRVSLQ